MSWFLLGARALLPLGFLVALLQAELFAGAVRGRLLEQLLGRPSPQQWRDAVAAALDDPPVRVGYWDPAAASYREADGAELTPPDPRSRRSRVEAHRDGQRIALRASRIRVHEVGAAERKRIKDNPHDSAQQRLAALRIRLALTSETVHGPEQLELQLLGAEVDEAIEEVRTAASGDAPPELAVHGVAATLRSRARSGVMHVVVEDRGFGRRSEFVETTVCFCCAEALQNATKHAGAGASASVALSQRDGWLTFSVEDNGAGFDPDTVARGQGLENMNERVVAAGGSLTLETAQGEGSRISGRLPAGV
jgi:signal transduction histidine kinase